MGICVSIYVENVCFKIIKYISQPLRSGRILRKVNFLAEFEFRVWIQSFPSPRLVASSPRL